ncbi:MAG: TRAP transporter fused permease subunit [Desulfobacterota bacterium]|nr:TRAP transporter fused permease subunit [Thermodesulfobacteriota bacterium]
MRRLTGWLKTVVLVYGVSASLLHLYTSGFGTFEPRIQRGLHLLFLLPLIFLLFPATPKSPKHRPSLWDGLAALLCLAGPAYIVKHTERLNFRMVGVDEVLPIEMILGTALVLLVVEAARRALSRWMALTILIALFYLATAPYWPGLLRFKGYSFPRMVEVLFLAVDEGIFGFLTGISSNILFIYILFAGFMISAGVGNFLIDFAVWAAGWARGGPAKIAVISSSLYGTVSGSTVANVYATGSFTIPLMKKAGFLPKQAAAIEAISSTGGQLMPPIMGAGAFIMSEITGVPYFKIIQAAALPALLYYLGLFFVVHFLSGKHGMESIPKAERPSILPMLRHAYFFLPFLLVVILLAYGYSPSKAAFYVIWVIIALSFFDKKTWLTPRKLIDTLFQAAVNAAIIATALAGSGMVVGILTRTGAALAFGSVLLSASFNHLLLAMILIFLVVSVLGTGIPTTPAYIIAVTVGASTLGKFEVALLAAHLFVFYYAVLSDLTPPDAITAFAAANVAGSEMMATGIEAFKLGIAGFLIPFAFVFQPALLLQGTVPEILLATGLTGLGVISLSAFLVGYIWSPLNWPHRLLFATAAVFLVFPTLGSELIGVGLAGGGFIWARLRKKSDLKGPRSR